MLECDDLVYKLTVSNMSEVPILFKVVFNKGANDVNLSWPVNGIKGQVAANEVTTIALLPKIHPNQSHSVDGNYEIEKLSPQITWKRDEEKIAQLERFNAPEPVVIPEEKPSVYEAPQSDEKNCGICTFLNPMSAKSCSICGSSF